jgi:Leucine-rich repeat (LRR) protein
LCSKVTFSAALRSPSWILTRKKKPNVGRKSCALPLKMYFSEVYNMTTPATFATDHQELKILQVIGNRLGLLPKDIGEMYHLLSLDVGVNRLQELPESLGQQYKLIELDVRMNNLTAFDRLPPWIGDLASLNELKVQHNQLRRLPEEIGPLCHGKDRLSLGKASCASACAVDCPRFIRGNGFCDDSKYFYHANVKPHSHSGEGRRDDGDCPG